VPNNNSVTLQIPLTITVSVGGAAGQSIATVPGVAAAAPGAELEAVVIDPDWKAREGYQTDFLGVEVPLPQLSAGQLKQTAIVSPDLRKAGRKYEQYELCYWNYSVLMNKRYRTAWFSAANVDGNHRFNLGPRKGDKWFVDPRISAAEQLSQDAFETGIDRGHLTRREDAAWGDTAAIATKSCNDTFHFTNCSLQASAFNRGKDRWQGLEQFLLEKHAEPEKRRMVVITGPVFNTKDPTYRNSKMDASVPCPLQFWKVCVLLKAGNGLSATGFILGQQDIAQLSGFEAFDVGAAQITLAQLEAKTNLKFGNLKQYDHFAKTGEKGALEVLVEGSKQRFLHSFDEIVV
jgi:endonuclease G